MEWLTLSDNASLKDVERSTYHPVVIIKCTRKCNLRCVYCADYRRQDDGAFDVSALAALMRGFSDDESVSGVHFIWHGGEPLTRGEKYFRKVLFLQERLLAGKQTVTNSIQTNGTLLTPQWAGFMSANRFSCGLSLDGPQEIHDANRPTAASFIQAGRSAEKADGSFELALHGLELLRQAHVSTGVLTVVSRDVIRLGAQATYRFLREQGIENIALLWMRGSFESAADSLRYNHEYGDFMAEILHLWLEEDNPAVCVREVDSKLNRMLGLGQTLCKDGGPCVGKFFGAETDGAVYHCDKFVGDPRYRVGDFQAEGIGSMARSRRIIEIAQLELDVRNHCRPCRWFQKCQGGCLSDLSALLRDGGAVDSNDCWNFRLYEELSRVLAHSAALQKLAGAGAARESDTAPA